MILSGVLLPLDAANGRVFRPDEHKQVFGEKAERRVLVDDFNVGEPLSVRAYLVLTLHDHHAVPFQHAIGFPTGLEIKIQNGIVILWALRGSLTVRVGSPERGIGSRPGQVSEPRRAQSIT